MKDLLKIVYEFLKEGARHVRGWHREAPIRTWLCLIAFCVSFGYALIYQIAPSVDARKFHEIAVNLVTKGIFCFECNVPLAEDTAIRDIGPGYQFFLTIIYKMFGIHLWIIWLLQALMHAVVVAWIWRLTRLLLDVDFVVVPTSLLCLRRSDVMRWLPALPLVIYAVHPDIVQNNAMLMADTLFTFLFVGIVMLFLPYLTQIRHEATGWWRFVALGVLLGVITMVRPTGLPVFIAVMGVLLWKRAWRHALIALSCFIAVQAPWAIRNITVYDHFIYNSVVGGLDIWVGLDPNSSGEFDLDRLPEITERIKGLAPEEIDRVSAMEVKKIIQEQPVFAAQRIVSKFFKIFALTKTSAFWFHYAGAWDRLIVLVLSIMSNVVLLGFGFAAIVYSALVRDVRRPLLWVAVVAILLMSIGPTIAVVVNRYRIPMLPFFTLLSVYWLSVAQGRQRWMSLAGAMAFLCVATGIDLWGSWEKVMERIRRF